MKKHIIRIGILALLLTSCHTKTKKEETSQFTSSDIAVAEEELQYDSFVIQLTDTLISGQPAPNYTIALNLPFCKDGSPIAEAINQKLCEEITGESTQQLDSSFTAYAQKLSKTVEQELREAYDPDSEDLNMTLQYHILIGGEFSTHPLKGHVAYSVFTDIYTGGPHGNREIKYMNFDKSTGKYLNKEDVFDTAKEQLLIDLILKKIMSDRGCENIEQLHKISSINVVGELYVGNNFLLEDSGVTFVYNTYEIASYADGTIFVYLPYEDLKEILKIQI